MGETSPETKAPDHGPETRNPSPDHSSHGNPVHLGFRGLQGLGFAGFSLKLAGNRLGSSRSRAGLLADTNYPKYEDFPYNKGLNQGKV